MIRSEEYEGAGKMVSLLAKFFRISLSQGKDMIPLEKELEHASSYLAIQNIRFKDKFEFQIEADPALLKYLCPKLSIQPLLENRFIMAWRECMRTERLPSGSMIGMEILELM